MKTVATWINRHRSFTVRVAENIGPSVDEDGWEHYAYELEVTFQRRKMTLPWKHGLGVTDFPEDVPHHILDAMVSAYWTWNNALGFEDYCSEFGYDTDSIKALRLWEDLEECAKEIKRVIGADTLEDLALNYERL